MVIEGHYQPGGVVGEEVLGGVQIVAVLEIEDRMPQGIVNSVVG